MHKGHSSQFDKMLKVLLIRYTVYKVEEGVSLRSASDHLQKRFNHTEKPCKARLFSNIVWEHILSNAICYVYGLCLCTYTVVFTQIHAS